MDYKGKLGRGGTVAFYLFSLSKCEGSLPTFGTLQSVFNLHSPVELLQAKSDFLLMFLLKESNFVFLVTHLFTTLPFWNPELVSAEREVPRKSGDGTMETVSSRTAVVPAKE